MIIGVVSGLSKEGDFGRCQIEEKKSPGKEHLRRRGSPTVQEGH